MKEVNEDWSERKRMIGKEGDCTAYSSFPIQKKRMKWMEKEREKGRKPKWEVEGGNERLTFFIHTVYYLTYLRIAKGILYPTIGKCELWMYILLLLRNRIIWLCGGLEEMELGRKHWIYDQSRQKMEKKNINETKKAGEISAIQFCRKK